MYKKNSFQNQYYSWESKKKQENNLRVIINSLILSLIQIALPNLIISNIFKKQEEMDPLNLPLTLITWTWLANFLNKFQILLKIDFLNLTLMKERIIIWLRKLVEKKF